LKGPRFSPRSSAGERATRRRIFSPAKKSAQLAVLNLLWGICPTFPARCEISGAIFQIFRGGGSESGMLFAALAWEKRAFWPSKMTKCAKNPARLQAKFGFANVQRKLHKMHF
jgi:hypothetical protein